jgi:FkbM family methyltransferase
LSNDDFVRRVRADGVHILVEINGHSPGHRFAAMASRCAPIQVSYLNYTSTCGVDEVDYILGDEISVPAGTDIYFTEKVYRIPGCFFCFTYDGAVLPPVAPPPSLATGAVTFGCFGSGGKINPPLLDLWADILRRTPHSRLFVRNNELTPDDNRQAMVRAFEQRGIPCERLLVLPGTNRQGVLESYAQVDISLDTFPYCGGNTIAESLWQGVPVVTLKGDRMSAAYGASLLTASGLSELVAETPADYIEIAVALASDGERLAAYRANLRTMVHAHGFSDADKFTARLETAYLDMMARRFRTEPEHNWGDALSLLPAAGSRDIREEWARRFGRAEFASLNRTLVELGSRGLGLDNGVDSHASGERWLLDCLAPLLSGTAAPIVFDVGAHEGGLALDILRALPTAQLHAFEPVPSSFDVLKAALAGTGASVSQLALGASSGTLRLHNHGVYGGTMHASSYDRLFDRFYGTETWSVDVPMTTIDHYCSTGAIGHVDLLKIDTEGHELDVLHGAAQLLRTGGVRLLLFEFNYTHIFSRTFFSDIFEALPDFVFFRLLPHGLLPLSRRDWSGTEVFRYQNVLALPEANRRDLTWLLRGEA